MCVLCDSMCVDVRGMGVVAGAVVGVSFGVLLIILIIWLVFRKKDNKKYEEEETPNEIRYTLLALSSKYFWSSEVSDCPCSKSGQPELRGDDSLNAA